MKKQDKTQTKTGNFEIPKKEKSIPHGTLDITKRRLIFGDYFILVFLIFLYVTLTGFSILSSTKPSWLAVVTTEERRFEASLLMSEAKSFIDAQKPEEALLLLNEARKKTADIQHLNINTAIALMMLGQKDQAIEALKQELKMDKWNPSNIYYFLSDIYRNNGDQETADYYFQLANDSNPNRINKYKTLGNKLLNEERFEDAIVALEKELLYRKDMKIHYENMLIGAIESLSDEPKKMELLKDILKRGIDDNVLNKYDKKLFNLFLNSQYHLAQNYNQLGYCQARIGKYESAYDNVLKALQIYPSYPDAQTNYKLLKQKLQEK